MDLKSFVFSRFLGLFPLPFVFSGSFRVAESSFVSVALVYSTNTHYLFFCFEGKAVRWPSEKDRHQLEDLSKMAGGERHKCFKVKGTSV